MTRSEVTFILAEVYEAKSLLRDGLRSNDYTMELAILDMRASKKVLEKLIGKLEQCRALETPGKSRTEGRTGA